jgi:hypothetical protein
MKVKELLFVEKQLIAPNDYDRQGTPMKLPNMYKNINYGRKHKVTPQTVTIKSSGKDHKIYGRKTIVQK